MSEWLEIALKISLVIFMAGNLFGMGLVVKLREALAGLRDVRFMGLSLLLGFVLCPGLAYLLATWMPMREPYGVGMILLGMAPCAPFLPALVEKAGGDMGYAAAFMLLVSVVTVLFMPLMVPLLVDGLSTDAWTIAKPLLFVVLIPMMIGVAVQLVSAPAALKLLPMIKKVTSIATIIMLVLCVIIYGRGFIDAFGAFAVGSQLLFYILAICAGVALGAGLPREQMIVLVLGICTRNLGAALAPLFSGAGVDEQAVIMVVLGVPLMTIAGLLTARWLARRSTQASPAQIDQTHP